MRAMVLAAGLGTRLRPLTHEIPKPVVPVLGVPLCAWGMEFLRGHGADAFLLNLHHGPEAVREKLLSWAGGRFPVHFLFEPQILIENKEKTFPHLTSTFDRLLIEFSHMLIARLLSQTKVSIKELVPGSF